MSTRILIVEDEGIIARDIQQQLRALGYEPVDVAASGDEAIEKVERLAPALVLMDIHLDGEMDGIEAATRIRARFATPVVFLTAYATNEVVERAKRAEPSGYIIKPFDEQMLRTTIEIALNKDRVERELRLRSAALDAAADAIIITDHDHKILWGNPAFTALTGYSPGEAMGRRPYQLLESVATGHQTLADVVRALRETGLWTGELVSRRKDRAHYIEEVSITQVRGADGRPAHFIGVLRDVSAQRRLQQQFLQAQKMEVVGRLAGGIAHDFNNLLTVINGASELALMELKPGDPMRGDFLEIREAAERAARLTRQLLSFSRKERVTPAVLRVGEQVTACAAMLRRILGEDVCLTLRTACPDVPDTVRIDQGSFEQLLLNLAVNARDAMPDGGTLTIETGCADLDEAFLAGHTGATPGPHVTVSVRDTGVGMSDEVRSHIFEPFYTTKGEGKGTGLGLATVYGIVALSGGCVAVESSPGEGAEFKIYLPRVPSPSTHAKPASDRPLRGVETILLVEDEQGLRDLAARMLRSMGYDVLAVCNGEEALATLRARSGPVHMLFTDVVMPGMSGPSLAARLVAMRPGLRVLFSSGYLDEGRGPAEVSEASHFIAKPYTVAALTRKVRQVLDALP